MSNVLIPTYLSEKMLPTNKNNLISNLKEKYGWKTYGDISENQLENVYNNDFDKFWTLIKYLTFQGFKFKGKLNRYNFSSGNGGGYHLYLPNQEQGLELDYEYTYAFLKIQLLPNGVYEKYDLHLLPLDHVLHENLDIDRAMSFFEKEGFTILEEEALKDDKENISTLSNTIRENLSTENNLIFYVGETTYTMSSEKAELPLDPENITPSRILHTLIGYGYKKVKDLPSDLNFLLELKQIGTKSVLKFLQSISDSNTINDNIRDSRRVFENSVRKCKTNDSELEFTTILQSGNLIYLGEEIPFKKEWMQIPILKDEIDEKIYQLFNKYNFQTIGELPADIEDFLRNNGFKKAKSKKLSTEVFNLLSIQALEELLSRTLKHFVNGEKPGFLSKRDWEMVYQRVYGKTLNEVGKMFNVTREGARQAVKKSMDKMFNHYSKYFGYISEKIEKSLFLNIHLLFNEVDVNIMRSIIEVHRFPFNIYNDYLFLGNREDFQKVIDKFKSDIKTKYDDTHIYTREEIELYVINFLIENTDTDHDLDAKHVAFLTNDLINDSFEPLNMPNHYIYKQRLTKARMCQIVFEAEFPDGLYVYKEIDLFVEKLLKYFPNEFKKDSSRSIISNLIRDEDVIILWKVGYYKHISAVHPDVNSTTLAPIKNWLQSQLSETKIQINTNLAFQKFSEELKRLEIDSEHALFSLLKIYFPDAFNYSRSPTLVINGHERLEKKKILENYVRSQNDYVSNDILIDHFINSLGWTKTMYEQNVSASEYLIKTLDGLIHIDCLGIEIEDLDNIFKYVKNKMNELRNSFSIETVFEERKSTLLQMNIKDSRVLYHLLEMYYPEEFDFYRYPYIHPVGKYEEEQLSVAGQFETFFLEEDDIFLRDELYEEFVKERGWAMSTYYMAFRKTRDIILEVFPEEYAHINLVEWTKEKAEKLFKVLEEFLLKIDKPFVHIDREIISNDSLINQFPEINPMFDWNHTLLTSILQNTDHFVLLGTKKAGILSKKNPYGIQNVHDFISYLLKNEFNGYVKVTELQKYLYRIDMCNETIPKYYLTPECKEIDYQLINDEVILKELVVGK